VRTDEAEQLKARQRISTMEGVLERAVMNGADNLLRQVESVMPDAALLSGAPQVRGFRLDNYGVFFDVAVPALRLSIVWMVKSMQSGSQVAGSALADLKSALSQMPPVERERLAGAVQRLELALGLTPPQSPARTALRPGGVGAAAVLPPTAAVLAADNPNELWTREVKAALMEAMLENSNALEIADQEWLTVAARDNVPSDPRIPGDSVDSRTVIFRVKGADLAAFHGRRIALDEARKRVEVREY
jgi:hypothetical protein